MCIIANPKLRVLVLEDSDLDAESVLGELKRGGIESIATRVQTRSEFELQIMGFQPEIILADYKLPNFDGGQALALARQHCPQVPVIIISGAVGEETAVELLRNGATDFVLKDRLRGRLVPAVQRALREVAERHARRKAEIDLCTLNAQLEQRVVERTHELWEKNLVMEEDLKMARKLQLAFLPEHFPTLPSGATQAASAVRFCSIFEPTSSMSGDFYNVVRVSDTAVGIFICDVMGHGVRAALVTAMMRALEEQLSELNDNPGALLTEMNRSLRGILRQLDTTLYTTACYLIVDIASGRLTFANAGHPSPLLVCDATDTVETISAPSTIGPALGLFDDAHYLTHERPVDAGDLVLVFTDGLFGLENANSETFGMDRLRESIRRHIGLPLTKFMQDIFTEIEIFAGGRAFPDDICLVGVEIAHLDARAHTLPNHTRSTPRSAPTLRV